MFERPYNPIFGVWRVRLKEKGEFSGFLLRGKLGFLQTFPIRVFMPIGL